MKRRVMIRLLAIGFGLLVFWAGAEVACRLIFSHVIAYDVEMWRYSRLVKVSGLTPGLRFEHRPGTIARLMGVEVRINDDGLRDRDISRKKPEQTIRVAVVGDSVTFGWGVDQDRTYPRQLERILNDRRPLGANIAFEVLNFGVGNYAVDDITAMLRTKAVAYDPDLVIYGAFLNDAELPKEVTKVSPLLSHSLAVVWIWGRLDAFSRQIGTRGTYREYYQNLYHSDRQGQLRVKTGVAFMQKICSQRNIPLVVAMLPELHEGSSSTFASVYQVYQDAAAEVGATYIDLQTVLSENEKRSYWVSPDDAHPNAEACALYAERLVAGIEWLGLLNQEKDAYK